MNLVRESLLQCLGSALCGKAYADPCFDEEQWNSFLRLSAEQEIFSLIFHAVSGFSSLSALPVDRKLLFRQQTLDRFCSQVRQTNEFLTLVQHMQAAGLDPIVLKGILCRSLYPIPSLRPSVDEDLLVPPEEAERYHRFLLSEGMICDDPAADPTEAEELSYHRENSPLYIELHTSLFPMDAEAYSDLNALFQGAEGRSVRVQVENLSLRALAPGDHLLFLICHAYKHLLHGGVGIRQVADMALLANAHLDEINWEDLAARCRQAGLETFAAALFRIAVRHLTLREIPAPFASLEVDVDPLLEDILSDGVYGMEDEDRAHSGRITLEAVAAAKQGREERGIWHSLFPGKSYLQTNYPYARKYPVLVPVAWANRLLLYVLRRKGDPGKSIQIGRERVELLRKYKIIP